MNKYTIKQWQDKTNKLYGWNRFEIIKVGYDGCIDPTSVVKCKTCNTKFECTLSYFTGQEKPGCMAKALKNKSTCVMRTLEYAQRTLNEKVGHSNYIIINYAGTIGATSTLCCSLCGYGNDGKWTTSLNNIMNQGKQCSGCIGRVLIKTIDAAQQRINERHGDKITIIQYSGNTSDTSTYRCNVCTHNWSVPLEYIIDRQKGTGCPKCVHNARVNNIQDANARVPSDTIEIIDYAGTTHAESLFECKKCSCTFRYRLDTVQARGYINCPHCEKKSFFGEKYIANVLDKMNVPYETQKKFKGLGQKRFDFYIPCIKAVIEFNGQQHYKPDHYWNKKAKKGFWGGVFLSDIAKRIYCKTNGIRLIEIDNANEDWQMWAELYLQSLLAEMDY